MGNQSEVISQERQASWLYRCQRGNCGEVATVREATRYWKWNYWCEEHATKT